MVSRKSHKLQNAGSSPAPATNSDCDHTVLEGDGKSWCIEELIGDTRSHKDMRSLLDGRSGMATKYNFCPFCGAKINWRNLKKTILAINALRPRPNWSSILCNWAGYSCVR